MKLYNTWNNNIFSSEAFTTIGYMDFFTDIFRHDRRILLINVEGNLCKGTFPPDFMPGGIQLDVVSGSVNTQMWDNIQSALTVEFHLHPRVQAPDFAPLKK